MQINEQNRCTLAFTGKTYAKTTNPATSGNQKHGLELPATTIHGSFLSKHLQIIKLKSISPLFTGIAYLL